ncbi:hypothetical protein B4Q13_18005, partial [Lacticaseibacillus rhamnosus]
MRRGEAVAQVIATGERTKFGRTAELVRSAKVESSQQKTIFAVVRNLALFNGVIRKGEHVRVFPISNWTELDVWSYIERETLEIPSIYYAHEREVFERDGILLAVNEYLTLAENESPFTATDRYRTVGDMTITGAAQATAAT